MTDSNKPFRIDFIRRSETNTSSDTFMPQALGKISEPWCSGTVSTVIGEVPVVSTSLNFKDITGSWKARWGIGRMHFTVNPGLYAVGSPDAESPVLVTANYKMTFDKLRSKLDGIDAWIMVLDTKGINVWCAAGKGTFGTREIISKVHSTGLGKIVNHRTLILPQLGAPGVSAHEVKNECGFRVIYGPVRAVDIKAFISSSMKSTPEMRRVRFGVFDRTVLIPMEIVLGLKPVLLIAAGFLIVSGIGNSGYSIDSVKTIGIASALVLMFSFLWSSVMGPILLPLLPGRAFSVKGAWLGFIMTFGIAALSVSSPHLFSNRLQLVSWAFIIPTITSYTLMNFTGASTYTSLSGVRREMRAAVPIQIAASVIGVGMWIGGLFTL